MSSIAYITEKHQLEFHRLNGDTTMNFWRPGKIRNFTDFSKGDLLFFLAKGSERGPRREKGIVGYGKLKEETQYSVKKMWKEYQQLNGYQTEDELREALVKMTKSKGIPKKIQGLFLEEVIFFQSPIYLSELGFQLSNKAEGYIYLDKDDAEMTTKILQKAKEGGVDMWMAALSDEAPSSFEEDEIKHLLSVIYKKNKDNFYTDSEKRKARKLAESLVNQNDFEYIKGSKMDCVFYQEGKIILGLPLVYNSKDRHKKTQYLLGHCMSYCLEMKKMWNKPLKIEFMILSKEKLPKDVQHQIESLNEWINEK